MSKPYTEDQLIEQLTSDRTWRLKEISDLKSAIRRADAALQRVLLRALVALCYAHWEGYVRFSAKKFLEHISLRKFKYSQLDRQFFRNYFIPRLAAMSMNKTNLSERCKLIDDILGSEDSKFSWVNSDLINTKSNLNFEVFSDICTVCGINPGIFDPYSTFMDVILLKRRNSIAHGEETLVHLGDLDQIADDTISLIRCFGDQLENRAVLQEYKRTQQA